MNNMKRLIAVVMMLSVVLCFAACTGNSGTSSTPAPSPHVPSTPVPSTPVPTSSTPAAEPNYIVTVVDTDGNPIVGAFVQICDSGSMCFIPVETDANGQAKFFDIEIQDGLKARVMMAEGYVLPEEYTYLENGQTELTLTLEAEAAE